jgi:hypothetical protein
MDTVQKHIYSKYNVMLQLKIGIVDPDGATFAGERPKNACPRNLTLDATTELQKIFFSTGYSTTLHGWSIQPVKEVEVEVT